MTTKNRDAGYYWVSIHGHPPEVARWNCTWWQETGASGGVSDNSVRVLSERLELKASDGVLYCEGCGDGMEPDPVPTLCVGCVNEALIRGVDPDPEELKAARIEQGPL